jgi:hypothetical protein
MSPRLRIALLGALLVPVCSQLVAAEGGERSSSIRFREASEAWGLVFHHHHGGSGERYMVETVVGGVVLVDYDSDGDVDVFFVDGGALPGYRGETPRSLLFRNDGRAGDTHGTPRFVDVTGPSGLRVSGYGAGAVSGDDDGDGVPDLYVTQLGPDQLFRNQGDGTFADRTREAGLGNPDWGASATFFDADRDGDLDLYVVNYVDFTIATHKFCGDRIRGIQGYCQPAAYEGVRDRLYVNRGGGTFVDGTEQAGLGGTDHAGLGVVAGDLDGDGWPDLYVANDADPNFLFLNRRSKPDAPHFEDVSLLSGTAYDDHGRPEGGMGVDLGDVDGDGALDIVVTNFEVESNALYRNVGSGLFVDGRHLAGIADASLPMLAFGVALADLDQDGDLDLAVANGHILDNAAELRPQSRFEQPNQVLENLGGGRFRELFGTGFEKPVRASRGLAAGDLDGDGDLDLVVVSSNERADVYENVTEAPGRWLEVDLRSEGANRLGVGARVELVAGGGDPSPRVREVRTGSSYLSQHAITLHFGLAAAARGILKIRWPGGDLQRLEGLPVDRRIVGSRALSPPHAGAPGSPVRERPRAAAPGPVRGASGPAPSRPGG